MDKNIVSIVGARPNFVKLFPIHGILKEKYNHTIIHTGQHYDFEMSEIFFKEFNLPSPDINLDIGSGLPCYQVGEMIKKIEELFSHRKFDLVLVYGDTNSTFAGAFAGVKSNINVAHIEAGLRSFDKRMPEETNRILTDNLSDILFAPTKTASQNLLNENNRGKIIETGDLSVEVINESIKLSINSTIIEALDLEPGKYALFTMHRFENTSSPSVLSSIINAFEKLKDVTIVFPLHPRTSRILKEQKLYERLANCKNVNVIPPLGYIDFITLIKNSTKVVTDSGGLQKESYLLGIPCITIRENTEWVETVDQGWNVLVGTNTEKIVNSILEWYPKDNSRKNIFGAGNSSKLIKNVLDNFLN